MLGISKNAASNRIKKLEAGGYIKLHYTFQEGKKEIDRRYITLLPFPTEEEGVVSQTIGVVSQTIGVVPQTTGIVPQTTGIVPQTTGYGFTDDRYGLNLEVLDKILDNRLDNPLDNKLKKSLDKLLDEVLDDEMSEIDVLGKEETLDKVSLTDNDFDMFSTEFDDLAEAEFQRILNKNK
jgi:DNA-binding Lrp family transcriptional regulator